MGAPTLSRRRNSKLQVSFPINLNKSIFILIISLFQALERSSLLKIPGEKFQVFQTLFPALVQLHPQEVCQDCGQDYVPEVQVDHFHPRDVWQDHAQEVRVDHLHLQDVYRDYAQFFPQVDRSHLQSVRDHAHDA